MPKGFDKEKWAAGLTYAGDLKSQGAGSVMDMARDYNFNREGRMHSDASDTEGNANSWSALIPPAWFLQKNDDVHNAVMEKGADFHITGGNVGILHDQMTALPELYRTFGAQHQSWPVRDSSAYYPNSHLIFTQVREVRGVLVPEGLLILPGGPGRENSRRRGV